MTQIHHRNPPAAVSSTYAPESGAVVEGAGLTRRAGPCARLGGGAGVDIVHHRIPPRRNDAAAQGTDRVNLRPEQAERPAHLQY